MLSSILILAGALLSLIVLMIIHEFGHFIIAKKFGIRVDEFGIGYPPRLFGKKMGDTIYSINLIPLGAFVRIYGEEGLDAKSSREAGDSVLGVEDVKSFTSLKIWKRVLIIIGGVAAFWLAAIIIFSVVFATGADLPIGDQDVPGMTNARVIISQVSSGSPAQIAGMEFGDVVVLLGSLTNEGGTEIIKVEKVKDFQDFTKKYEGEQVIATVQRNGQTLELQFSPRVSPPDGQGAVGVGLERIASLIEKYPWYIAPIKGISYTWQVTVSSLVGLYSIFANIGGGKGLPAGAEFAGPLGITVFLANAASYGLGFFLYFIGAIAVFIAIFNLFPIPALDGGKLVFLLIEKVRGRPVSAKVEQIITVSFFIVLICLSLFITIRFDIPRFVDFIKVSLQK